MFKTDAGDTAPECLDTDSIPATIFTLWSFCHDGQIRILINTL